jgi:hypothetical protein
VWCFPFFLNRILCQKTKNWLALPPKNHRVYVWPLPSP